MSAAVAEPLRYNAWANARTFDACARVAPDARGEGVTRSLFDLLQHITGTEDDYLHLLRGDLQESLGIPSSGSPTGDPSRTAVAA